MIEFTWGWGFVWIITLFLIERISDNIGSCFNDAVNSWIPCSCKTIGSDFRIWGFSKCNRHNDKKAQHMMDLKYKLMRGL